MWLAAFRLFSSYLAIYNCCVSTATANSIQAWPCGQALSVIWTAYAVLCVPQLLCVHSDCIIVFQPSLAAKRSLYSLDRSCSMLCVPQLLCVHSDCIIVFQPSLAAKRSTYRLDCLTSALHGVQRFSICISAWPYGRACFLSFRPAHRPRCAARQHASTLAIAMLTTYDWSHHDCFQITLRSAMAVCLHSDCIIAFQLGLAAKRSF